MIIYFNGVSNEYDLRTIIEIFMPKNQIQVVDTKNLFLEKLRDFKYGLEIVEEPHQRSMILYRGTDHKVLVERTLFAVDGGSKTALKRTLYEVLETVYAPIGKWGILVGIRPVKIVHEFLDQGRTVDEIKNVMASTYLVHPDKIDLLIETALRERPHLYPLDQSAVSLYLCIPFCPTRCLYCSFPSNEISKKSKLLPTYLDLMIQELIFAVSEIKRSGKYIDCVYIGGGTPTTLDVKQLERLLEEIVQQVPIDQIKEFSVEAGRPDTISMEKLDVMKSFGVNRICINPQTMRDDTLTRVGRSHDSGAIVDVMKMARKVGFETINMDVIMGLPGETVTDTNETLKKLIELKPENLTVHTLAVKRASNLNASIEEIELAHDGEVERMLSDGDALVRQFGYTPYYMYRQKKMIGHLENIGYALSGHASLYNMRIMEERHTIVAIGAGAVSKICFPDDNRHERVANFKGLEDYISRFDEILEKKKAINELK